jgi:SAM-dependent methyltransferase
MFHRDGPTFLELVRQGLSSTERGYDLLAPKFDRTPFRTPDAVLEPLSRALAETFPFARALDLCCGTGAAMRFLRPLASDAVVGIDMSAGMLEEARRKLEGAPGDARVELVRGDVLAMPFGREFDVVTCFGAFGHILEHDEARFVDAVANVLRPGGRFVFVTADVPPWWSPGALVARGFNTAMRVRNALIRPPFLMYYLTFLLPRATALLEARGFEVGTRRGLFEAPFDGLVMVTAQLA